MYAIIETGGKQYRVERGDVIDVERVAVSTARRCARSRSTGC